MTKKITKFAGSNVFEFEAEDSGYSLRDTKVRLNGVNFCWIKFADIDDFVKDFTNLIAKYKI